MASASRFITSACQRPIRRSTCHNDWLRGLKLSSSLASNLVPEKFSLSGRRELFMRNHDLSKSVSAPFSSLPMASAMNTSVALSDDSSSLVSDSEVPLARAALLQGLIRPSPVSLMKRGWRLRRYVDIPHVDPYLYEPRSAFHVFPPHDPADPWKIPVTVGRGKQMRPSRASVAAANRFDRPFSPDFCPGWHGLSVVHGIVLSAAEYDELKAAIQNRVPPNVWVLPHDHIWYVWGFVSMGAEMRRGHGKAEITRHVFHLRSGTVLFSFVGAKMAPEVLQRVSTTTQGMLKARCKIVGHGFSREPWMV
eukprot:TRINITY_DN22730_c0_g1_i1.p1 TRINITY_DN22730_c0_g1~~TRINITY_DN22730_c0_g1_i1.p1  ORF type:complete len:307 (-),score=26.66 TRINITY_DN22730_c0_g1_i1:110-1030(-)